MLSGGGEGPLLQQEVDPEVPGSQPQEERGGGPRIHLSGGWGRERPSPTEPTFSMCVACVGVGVCVYCVCEVGL